MNSYFYFDLSAQYFCILHMWWKHTLAETMRQRMSPVTDCLSYTIICWSEATFYVFHLYLHLFFICFLFVIYLCVVFIFIFIFVSIASRTPPVGGQGAMFYVFHLCIKVIVFLMQYVLQYSCSRYCWIM